MSSSVQSMYSSHHQRGNRDDFSIMEEERGKLFSNYVGRGKTILDIGCRDGILTRYFVTGNDVTGVDVDERLLKKAHSRFDIKTMNFDLNGDWNELLGQKFDAIVAGEIIEHLYFPEKIIKQVKDHLRLGGIFVGSVPNAFNLKNRLRYLFGQKKYTPLGDPTHINHFHTSELQGILKKHFNNVEIIGLGKHVYLAKFYPNFFAFDIVFRCS